MSRKSLILLFMVLLASFIIYILWPSDASRIKKLYREGAEAIENEDIDTVMSKVSYNYHDEYGLTYLYIKENMKHIFQKLDDINIDYENISLQVKDKTATADMDVRVVATIGGNTGYILGDFDTPVHLTFTLEKVRTKWLVIKTEGLPFDF